MSALQSDDNRRLVPRWRLSGQTQGSRNIFATYGHNKRSPHEFESILSSKLSNWSKEKSLSSAIEVFVTANFLGLNDRVQEVINYLLKHKSKLPKTVNSLLEEAMGLGQSIILPAGNNLANSTFSEDKFLHHTREVITTGRKKLYANPKNVLAYLDIARSYTILGLSNKAEQSIERALMLFPNHRHVLRSAVRFYLNQGKANKAHNLLAKNIVTKHDPWLIAAELSLSLAANTPPVNFNIGKKLIEHGGLPPGQLTELLGSVGTLELFRGNIKKAKKNVRKSLIDPTENSVAQARWLSKQVPDIILSKEHLLIPNNYEARCYSAQSKGQWSEALEECINWYLDEPFSSRSATAGASLCISVLNDSKLCMKFANFGLRVDPTNQSLLNCKAIAHAYLGELGEAVDAFNSIKMDNSENSLPRHVYLATAGLLSFRLKRTEEARELYSEAEKMTSSQSKVILNLFRAREELFANNMMVNPFVQKMLDQKIDKDDLWSRKIQEKLLLSTTKDPRNPIFKF